MGSKKKIPEHLRSEPAERAADASGRRRVGAALRESESKYRRLFESIQDVFYRTDAQGIITEISPSVQRYGYTPEELIGTPVLEVYEDPQERSELLKALLEHGEVPDHEVRLKAKDGRTVVASASSRLLVGPDGAPIGVEGFLRDITERKQAEEALRKAHDELETRVAQRTAELEQANESLREEIAERRRAERARLETEVELSAIYDNAPPLMILVDRERRVRRVNYTAVKFAQRAAEEMIGRRGGEALRCMHSVDDPRGCGFGPSCGTCPVRRVVVDTFETGNDHYQREAKLQLGSRDGETTVLVSTTLLSLAEGPRVLVCMEDITERKRAEEALRESEERARLILETAYDAFISTDASGVITDWNAQAEAMFGWSRSEAVGRQLADMIIPPQYREAYRQGLTRLLATGEGPVLNKSVEVTALHRDGHEFPVELMPWPLEQGGALFFNAFVHDITERKRAEEALREQSEFLQSTLDALSHPFYVIDTRDYSIRLANAAAGFGRLPAGATCYALTHGFGEPCRGREHVCPLEEVKRTKASVTAEHLHYDRDGRPRVYEVHCYPIVSSDGNVTEVIEYGLDITERKQAEEALRESEERLRTVVTNLPVVLSVIGRDGVYTLSEGKGLEPLGRHPGQVVGQTVFDVHRDTPQIIENVRRALAGEAFSTTVEWRGSAFEAHYVPLCDERGEVTSVISVASDVTERKQAEEALRESEERLRTVVTNAPVILFAIDREGVVTLSEGKGLASLGLEPGEVAGRSVFDMYSDTPQIIENVRRALDGETFTTTVRVSGLAFETQYEPLRNEDGQVAGVIAVATNVTDRSRAEEELERHRRHLAELVEQRTAEVTALNKELEAFVHSVSHDLRAPLRSINGFSRALLEDYADKLDAPARDSLHRVRKASQRMGRLIDDLLTLSRVAQHEIRLETVDLSALAKTVAEELQEREPERQVTFEIEEGLAVSGDASLLQVVLENLLGNAWKFTRENASARIEFGSTQSGSELAYFVCDNGVGFDMASVDRLFSPFQRLHPESEFPGTGIGLATVQRIIYRHGGRVWAEGSAGQGATFYFTLRGQVEAASLAPSV